MNHEAAELARIQSRTAQCKSHLVGAYYASRLPFDVCKIISKRAELADILVIFKILKAQAGRTISGQSAGSERTGRSVEADLSAVQLNGKTCVHGDGNCNLISSRICHLHGSNRT